MKKNIAILGSSRKDVFEEIVKYFQNKDVEITCLSDNNDSEILKSAKELQITNKYLPVAENSSYFSSTHFDLIALTDYSHDIANETRETGRFINIHPSLLPSFNGKNAISQAFLSGVKVSGVTIYSLGTGKDSEKIIAQYPVLIGLTTHIDEFETDIYEIEKKLYPPVIEAIIEDRVFDFQDLFKNSCHKNNSCSGGCNGCQG